MLITDAQVHLWEVERPERPWPRPIRVEPQKPAGWGAGEMLAEMDAAGVDRAVIVPPSWIGDSNVTALEAAAAHPTRFAVMGRFDPFASDAAEQLETWLQQPHMLGIRMSFHVEPYSLWLDDGSIDWFWTACERLGIPVMVLVPGIADKMLPVVTSHPDLTLVIDHLGVPLDATGERVAAELGKLEALAKLPKVSVKVSSAPNFSAEPYPYHDLDGFLRRLYDAFGPQRMMWGADITRLLSTYSECLAHFRDALAFLTAEDREWILGGAVTATLNWPPTT